MKAIRFGLQRKFKQLNENLDIISDTAFNRSNTIFQAQLVQLKKKGYGKIEQKPPIVKEDIVKLYNSPSFSLGFDSQVQNSRQ